MFIAGLTPFYYHFSHYKNTPRFNTSQILHYHGFQILLGITVVPREIEDNANAKFWGVKQGVLWAI